MQSYPVVEMQYQRRDDGFLGLGSYFDGGNTDRIMMKETQPVIMRYDLGRVRREIVLRFVWMVANARQLRLINSPLAVICNNRGKESLARN